MRRITVILIISFFAIQAFAQVPGFNPYDPQSLATKDWKFAGQLYFSDASNSNAFSNDFFRKVNRSEYLDATLKNEQLGSIDGNTLTGSIREIGGEVFLRNKNKYFYLGLENQHVLDTKIDKDLLNLLLLGNKSFAGQTLEVPSTEYYSLYFTQLKFGMGFNFAKNDIEQVFAFNVNLNAGQNYNEINLDHSSFYTHPDGDFLDVSLHADTRLSDTAWAEVSEVNGLGFSGDLFYSVLKEKNFYVAATVKNIGFIQWNKSPFVASIDTNFIFDGLTMDTTQTAGDDLPDDFSYDNLRRIAFKNPDNSPFSTALPVMINVTGGKFFSEGRYYLGLNTHFYPSLKAAYRLELFFTWRMKNVLSLTPLISYSSFEKLNYGLAFNMSVSKNIAIQAGSSYLNSLFSKDALAGSGGFARISFTF